MKKGKNLMDEQNSKLVPMGSDLTLGAKALIKPEIFK